MVKIPRNQSVNLILWSLEQLPERPEQQCSPRKILSLPSDSREKDLLDSSPSFQKIAFYFLANHTARFSFPAVTQTLPLPQLLPAARSGGSSTWQQISVKESGSLLHSLAQTSTNKGSNELGNGHEELGKMFQPEKSLRTWFLCSALLFTSHMTTATHLIIQCLSLLFGQNPLCRGIQERKTQESIDHSFSKFFFHLKWDSYPVFLVKRLSEHIKSFSCNFDTPNISARCLFSPAGLA